MVLVNLLTRKGNTLWFYAWAVFLVHSPAISITPHLQLMRQQKTETKLTRVESSQLSQSCVLSGLQLSTPKAPGQKMDIVSQIW